jgi:hypothetical protein
MMAMLMIMISVKFQKFHYIGGDRISALDKVSYQYVNPDLVGSATAVGVMMDGKVFGVTAAHTQCKSNTCPNNLIACDNNLDVALILECPEPGHVLDGSQYTNSTTADDAFVRGFSDININSYKASIGGLYGHTLKNSPFRSQPIINPNYRYLVGASQSLGLSGSCVLNGYGIVGVAVAEERFPRPNSTSSFNAALVVPWADIRNCIHRKFKSHVFPTSVECKTAMVLIPTLLNKVEDMVSKGLRHPVVRELASTVYHYL